MATIFSFLKPAYWSCFRVEERGREKDLEKIELDLLLGLSSPMILTKKINSLDFSEKENQILTTGHSAGFADTLPNHA